MGYPPQVSVPPTEISPPAKIRWGITREPIWVDGLEVTGPLVSAGTSLVTKTVSSGKLGRIFGLHIAVDEANQFQLYQDSTVIKRFPLNDAGVIHVVLATPLLNNVSGVIAIKNVAAATSGKTYQSSLLYDEA